MFINSILLGIVGLALVGSGYFFEAAQYKQAFMWYSVAQINFSLYLLSV